jgi:hypothetical protein
VEELMFQLVCDPTGVVVETALNELVPAVIEWGNNLDHVLRVLLSHILNSALVFVFLCTLPFGLTVSLFIEIIFLTGIFCINLQRCPPLSGVEGSIESHLRVLGERERWNVDVLLKMLMKLLPFVHQKAFDTCPFLSTTETTPTVLSIPLLELYAR